MTEVRCFTKARGLNLGHELNMYVPSCVCVCSGWAWMESHWSSLIWQLTFFHCYSYNIYKYSNNYNCINKKKHIFHKKWIQLERDLRINNNKTITVLLIHIYIYIYYVCVSSLFVLNVEFAYNANAVIYGVWFIVFVLDWSYHLSCSSFGGVTLCNNAITLLHMC